ncbi:signal transduction histidine kinase [Rothia mucilaginosa DY-18]|uniref:Signal transduction histidine kinase n=2 Tax=Rothia mucilaginosa TaxID=43675 RepID=D2NT15_ROTMD|nr:signal transduction histidine kinase [Rothia mucilaginosa DY-18]
MNMPNSAVSHIQQQYAVRHPQCNTFALDKPKSAAYGYTAAFIAFNNADGTPTNETLTLDTIHAAAEACQVIDMGFDYTPYYDGEPVNPPTCHLIMGTNFGKSDKKYALSSLYGTARIYLITADAPTVKVDGFMTKLSMFVNKMRNSETWNRAKAYLLSTSPAGEELQSFACSFTTFAMPRKYIVDHEKPWRPEKEIVVNNSLQMAFRPGIFWPKQSAVDPSRPLTVRASEGPATFDSLSDLTCGGVPVEKAAKALEKRQNINTYIYHFAYPKNLGEQPNLAVISYMVDVLALHLRELDKLQLAPNAQPPLEWTMEDMLFNSALVVQDLAEQSGVPECEHLWVPSGQPRQRTPHTGPKRPAPAQPAPAAAPASTAKPAQEARPAPAQRQAPAQPQQPNPRPAYSNPPRPAANQATANQAEPAYQQAPQPAPEYRPNPQGYQNQGYADAPYRAESPYRPDAHYHPGAQPQAGAYQAQGYQPNPQHPQANYPYQPAPPQYQQNPAYQQEAPSQQRPVFQPTPTGTRNTGNQKGFWGKVASFLRGE